MIDYNLKSGLNQSFAVLMEVKPLEMPHAPEGIELFQSVTEPFQPMKDVGNAFGGHVLGQVIVATAKTVPTGFVCNSSSAYFLRPGLVDVPYIYAVEKLREGARYLTRAVKVYQVYEDDVDDFRFQNKFVRFVAHLSFKTPGPSPLDFQAPINPHYSEVPDHEIIQMEMAPDIDTPALQQMLDVNGVEAQWHPIEARKMDTRDYNLGREVNDRRVVHFFRSPYELPHDVHVHIALLLYMSDRNSLFTLFNIWRDPYVWIDQLASLSHTFTLHNLDPIVDDEYVMMETWTDRAFDARGLYLGRMYDRSDRLIASFSQDGLVDAHPGRAHI